MRRLVRRIYRLAMLVICVRRNVIFHRDLHVSRGSLTTAPRRLEIGRNVIVGIHARIAVDGKIGDGCLFSSHVGVIGRCDHDHTKSEPSSARTPGLIATRSRIARNTA